MFGNAFADLVLRNQAGLKTLLSECSFGEAARIGR